MMRIVSGARPSSTVFAEPAKVFQPDKRKKVTADFEGGADLVRQRPCPCCAQLNDGSVWPRRRTAASGNCTPPDRLVHTLPTLLSFGMFAIACGHEDADDCNALREGRCPLQIPFRLGQQSPVPEPPLRVILAADQRAPVRVARPALSAVPHRSDFDDDLGSAALATRSQIRSEIQTAVVKRKVNLTGSPLRRMTFVNNDGADESLDNSH